MDKGGATNYCNHIFKFGFAKLINDCMTGKHLDVIAQFGRKLQRYLVSEHASGVIIGYPVRPDDGGRSPMCEEVERLIDGLQQFALTTEVASTLTTPFLHIISYYLPLMCL